MRTNLVLLTGNLGATSMSRSSGSATYARFSVATNYRVCAKDGDHYEDRTNWTRVTAFGGLAKTLGRLGKGSSCPRNRGKSRGAAAGAGGVLLACRRRRKR